METISRCLLTFLLNSLWQIPLVAAVAALGCRLMRNGPASHRHAVWVAALAACALLPLASVRVNENPSNTLRVPDRPVTVSAVPLDAASATPAAARPSSESRSRTVPLARTTAEVLLGGPGSGEAADGIVASVRRPCEEGNCAAALGWACRRSHCRDSGPAALRCANCDLSHRRNRAPTVFRPALPFGSQGVVTKITELTLKKPYKSHHDIIEVGLHVHRTSGPDRKQVDSQYLWHVSARLRDQGLRAGWSCPQD